MGKSKAKPKQPEAWRNRIVGNDMVAASQLLANPQNWRVHPKAQQDALAGALEQIGWIQDVIVNQQTGHVVDGHLRVSLALRQGDDTPVPVKYVDLTEAEEKLALATIDPLSAMAVADKTQLDALLREVNTDSAALQAMMADVARSAGIGYDRDAHGWTDDIPSAWQILIECESEKRQSEFLERFSAEGISCRALIS